MIVIDRLEGLWAVISVDGTLVDLPRSALPKGAREGSILTLELVDASEVLEEARERLERLKKSTPPGDDIEL